MQPIWNILSYALRQLRRAPAFTLTVIATLAIGIGLNAAIFAAVDSVLLRPLGYHDADRIVGLQTRFNDENRSIPRLGGDDYADLSRQVNGFEVTAYYQGYSDGIELNAAALYVPIAMVSPGFTRVMGVQPVAGRLFQPNATDAVNAIQTETLVSAAFARDHFGSAQAALGQAIHYGGVLRPIVGVLPDGFAFPAKTAVWFQAKPVPDAASRISYSQQAVGKRRRGVSDAQLAAQLGAFSAHLQAAYPDDRHKSIEAVPLQEQLTGKIRPTLHLLMGSVAVILLIVLANITHLQLVRATRELRAVTIRRALGASRGALLSHALVEAALLATAGAGAAVLLAVPALRLLVRLAPPDVPRLADIRLNPEVLLLSFAASLLLMSLTAVLPVWRSWHVDPAAALKGDAARGTESPGSHRLRNGLLVAEVALTLTLSVAAILLARQLIAQSQQDLGFSAERLIALDSHAVDGTPTPTSEPKTPAEKAVVQAAAEALHARSLARLDAALATVRSVPGVEAAEAMFGAPMGFMHPDVSYAVRSRQTFAPGVEHLPNADIAAVTPGLLGSLRIPLLRGRGLEPGDRAGAPRVLLISRQLAREVFPNENPLGKQIMFGLDDSDSDSWETIVGVVGDIRDTSPGAAPYPSLYVPIAQHPYTAPDVQIMVRTRTDPAAMVHTLRTRLKQTHPEIAVEATTMREDIRATQRADTFRTTLFASFAAVSILLAAVGIYGVTSYTVAQRSFEFGLRIALGASRAQLLGLVLRGALTTTLIGIAIGIALSLSLVRVLGSVVGKLPAFDGAAFLLAGLAVLLLALLATLLPARAAAHADPMAVLRSE